jgi:predicted DNA-binding protein
VAKTKKIQVTLEEDQYESLAKIARRQKRKLAAVVRESIEKYCLAPEAEQKKKRALEELLSVEEAPVPEKYEDWKRQYGALKSEKKSKK